MSYLLDTNILLRFVSPEDSMHSFNVKDFRRFQTEVTPISPRQMNDLDK